MISVFEEILPESKTVIYSPQITQNPYLDLLYESSRNAGYIIESFNAISLPKFFIHDLIRGNKRILHHHWYSANSIKGVIILPFKLVFFFLYKLIGSKLIWTIHNEFPHDTKYYAYNMFLRKRLAILSDILHVHGYSDIEILTKTYGVDREKFRVVRHPAYHVSIKTKAQGLKFIEQNIYTNVKDKKQIVLIFGQISKYKGITELLSILSEEKLQKNVLFLIVGRIKKDEEELIDVIKTMNGYGSEIILFNKYIDDFEMELLFGASDYILFNYKKILTSGSVVLAKSFAKKVIAPDKGNIREYLDEEDFLYSEDKELKKIFRMLDLTEAERA